MVQQDATPNCRQPWREPVCPGCRTSDCLPTFTVGRLSVSLSLAHITRMSFSPPSGVTFHTTDDVPVAVLSTVLRRVASFLQALQLSSPSLRLYHDWWQHDGLHFEKRRITFHDLFGMVETPRAIFEATPDEHEVFVGIAPEDSRWYLRFRADWDADDQSIIGGFAITVPSDLAAAFRSEVASSLEHQLVEEASESYYRSVMA